jgi:S1-C subfamily serine protease
MPVALCPHCHQRIPLDSGYLNRGVTCPICHHPFVVSRFIPIYREMAEGRNAQRGGESGGGFFRSWALILSTAVVLSVVAGVCVLLVRAKPSRSEEHEVAATPKTQPTIPTTAANPGHVAEAQPPAKMDGPTMARVKAATVFIRAGTTTRWSTGSGFYVGDGVVMTNHHVIDRPGTLEVTVDSGTPQSVTHYAKVIQRDRARDLALVGVFGNTHPAALGFANGKSVIETQDVYIFGFPFGERLGEEITVAKSSVSSFRTHKGLREIQFNGGIHSGNSGGPVTDSAGRVVGVSYAAITGSQIGLAIAGDEAIEFLDEYRRR